MIEIAFTIGLFVIPFFFLFSASQIEPKQSHLRFFFFSISLFLLLGSMFLFIEFLGKYEVKYLEKTEFDSDTGITTYHYNTTTPYANYTTGYAAFVNATWYSLFLFLAIFLISFLVTLINHLRSSGMNET